jgi:hypothetical protein
MSTKDFGPNSNENFFNFNNSPLPPLDWHTKVDVAELQDYFTNIRKSQVILKPFEVERESDQNLLKEVFQRRLKVVGYLQLLCTSYGFRNETFFKSLQLFDTYMYKLVAKILSAKKMMRERDREKDHEIKHIVEPAQNEFSEFFGSLILYAVLCLSLACKLEEVNCNYLPFFNDNLLKGKFNFTVQQLNLKETEILKKFNFKVSMPTLFQFNNTFVQLVIHEIFSSEDKFYSDMLYEKENCNLFANSCGANSVTYGTTPFDKHKVAQLLLQVNDQFVKNYTELPECIFNSPLTSALICFKASLLYLSQQYNVDIFTVQERLNKFVYSSVKNLEYIQKIDVEAYKVYTRVVRLENGNNFSKNENCSNLFYVKSNSVTTCSQ